MIILLTQSPAFAEQPLLNRRVKRQLFILDSDTLSLNSPWHIVFESDVIDEQTNCACVVIELSNRA